MINPYYLLIDKILPEIFYENIPNFFYWVKPLDITELLPLLSPQKNNFGKKYPLDEDEIIFSTQCDQRLLRG